MADEFIPTNIFDEKQCTIIMLNNNALVLKGSLLRNIFAKFKIIIAILRLCPIEQSRFVKLNFLRRFLSRVV